MRRLAISGLTAALLLLAVPPAQALGPSFVLGYDCQYYFTPPTVHVDPVTGFPTTPITGALTYNLYLAQSPTLPTTMPATPTISRVAGTTAVGDPLAGPGQTWKLRLCLNTNTVGGVVAIPTVGQWWLTVQAVEAGAGSSVQTSPPIPFVLAPVDQNPSPPTNGAVR